MQVKVRAANRAYRDSKGGFEAVFGDQQDFYLGLEAYSGRPMVAGDKKLYYEMRREFSECRDPRIRFITTTNNGNVNTVSAVAPVFCNPVLASCHSYLS